MIISVYKPASQLSSSLGENTSHQNKNKEEVEEEKGHGKNQKKYATNLQDLLSSQPTVHGAAFVLKQTETSLPLPTPE